MMRRLRIVVVEPVGSGGLLHFAHQLCGGLAAHGHDVTLITADDDELAGLHRAFHTDASLRLWPAAEPETHAAGRLRSLVRRARRAWLLIRAWVTIVAKLDAARPDWVLIGNLRFPFEALFLWWLKARGIRLAQICHEFEAREAGTGLRHALHKRLLGLAFGQLESVLFLARSTREAFIAAHPALAPRTAVVPHGDEGIFRALRYPGFSARRRWHIPDDVPLVLFFGGIRPSKGLDDLLEAFATVPRATGARLLIVGHPARNVDLAAIRAQLAEPGLAGRVVLEPRYADSGEVAGLLEAADLVVLPYRSATASGVLHLAMTFGRPVLATRVGGLAEEVTDGLTGRLVPPRDPAALAAALVPMLADRARLTAMGDAALRIVDQRHNWPAVAATVLKALGSGAAEVGRARVAETLDA